MVTVVKFEVKILNRTPVNYSVRFNSKGTWSLYCDNTDFKLGVYDSLGQACSIIENWHSEFLTVRAIC